MNPRQRRGLLLMIIAALGAVFVFITVLGYVGNVRTQAEAEVGEMTPVLQIQSPVEAFQPVTAASVKQAQIPKKWATSAFVTNLTDLQGKVAAGTLPAGAYLQQGMMIDAPSLKAGQREIAIMIDAETGVAGKVTNGAIVDVYASFSSTQNGRQTTAACAVRILNRVQVINVGQLRNQSRNGGQQQSEGAASGQVVPITFALNSSDTLKLTYAESFAQKVRLALVGGTEDPKPPFNRLCETPQADR
ncbi:Flp pilus assembly protein CpaB [Spirillospora sp. NPDC029432]|uniref:Flp pilus assembly protein CpaB n=1 Tax=Spirillospora sp. NPDC029432 TaxID=3154599 RepID=UPI0034513D37